MKDFDDALKGYYTDRDEISADETNADYRSLTAESVGSLILGFLSVSTFVSVMFIVFPVLGTILGIVAVRKILNASQIYGGLTSASIGVLLCAVFGIAGTSYQCYISFYELPAGYRLITFADLEIDPTTGKIPDEIIALTPRKIIDNGRPPTSEPQFTEGTPIVIEGYMFPTRQRSDITNFMLVPSIDKNPFGAVTRSSTEMLEVQLQGNLSISYQTSLVKVGGVLLVNPDPKPGEPPYKLLADVFR